MIGDVLKYLRDQLNVYLGNTLPESIQFPSGIPDDSLILPSECVTLLLVRIEEEKTMRFDERYIRTKGSENNRFYTRAQPAVPIHLYIFFIARFSDYANGLQKLSAVIQFFQSRPVFRPTIQTDDGPLELPELITELHTPTFTVQNEIWSALKAPQHPAVMYKITMLMLENEEITGDVIREVQTISAPISN